MGGESNKYIQKISKIVLLCILIISTIIIGFFYFGGNVSEMNRLIYYQNEPVYAGLLVNWVIFLIILTAGLMLWVSVYRFITKSNSCSKSLYTIGVICFMFLLLSTWLLGSAKPLRIPYYEGGENTFFWLKMADMCIYSIAILIIVTIGLIVFLAVKRQVDKKHK